MLSVIPTYIIKYVELIKNTEHFEVLKIEIR